MIYFIKSIRNQDLVIKYYEQKYQENINKQQNNEQINFSQANNAPYLDNIFILHLESINGLLVNDNNTPNLLAMAKQGIYFDNFYSNSIQTMGAYENILCSLPTSFNNNLVNNGEDKKISCLPKILSDIGYATKIFKGGARLENTGADQFARDIGFAEVHNADIMQPSDRAYSWGYREDLFYSRTFDYLQTNLGKKNFVYIDVGTTNHYPFRTPAEYNTLVPYTKPNTFSEKISNTLFLQDKFLGEAWVKINNLLPKKNYTILILSDNSWPIGLHGNYFNESGAYEENFRIPLLMIIGGQEKYQNTIVNQRFSQLDILPSILSAININQQNYYGWPQFSSSFWPESTQTLNKKIILIQPYSKKYLNIVVDQIKYQYNAQDKKVIKFDLSTDPLEENPTLVTKGETRSLEFIKQFFE